MSWDDGDDWDAAPVPKIVGGKLVTAAEAPKSSWSDEDEDAVEDVAVEGRAEPGAAAPGAAVVELGAGAGTRSDGPLRPKQIAKMKRAEAQARKAEEMAALAKRREEEGDELDDPAAERARRQKLVEDADHRLTEDLFGDGEDAAKKKKATLEDVLAETKLTTNEEMEALATKLAPAILKCDKGLAITHFLKHVCRAVGGPLTSDMVKDVERTLSALRNEKMKEKRGATKKKKFAGKQGFTKEEDDSYIMAQGGFTGGGEEYDDFM
mmetsp:Transcript_24371/g.68461  ORF Transcript_24371/g.68461 Transcript_24371/m.68461 type:complete len:266 (+) Transcript_24371:60-857(+)